MSRAKKIGISVAVLFASFIGYRLFLMYQMMHAAHPFPPMTVSTTEVKKERLPQYISAIGTLKAGKAVIVASEVAGSITDIKFESGQEIQESALIIQLNDEEEQATLKRYQAALEMANLSLKRSSSLTNQKIEALAAYEKKQTAYREAEAQFNQGRAVINRKQIRAPFAGRLGIRQINLGQYIQPGTPIVTLTNLSEMLVNFSLPEQDFSALKIGQKVLIQIDAFPNKTFNAILTSIDPQIHEDTRLIDIQATFSNPDGIVTPGMFATVKVETGSASESESIIVPETAVDYTLYGTTAYVVIKKKDDKSGKESLVVERRNITTGKQHRGIVEIKTGLKAGEQVVSAGQLKLNDGMPIVVNNDLKLNVKPSYTD